LNNLDDDMIEVLPTRIAGSDKISYIKPIFVFFKDSGQKNTFFSLVFSLAR